MRQRGSRAGKVADTVHRALDQAGTLLEIVDAHGGFDHRGRDALEQMPCPGGFGEHVHQVAQLPRVQAVVGQVEGAETDDAQALDDVDALYLGDALISIAAANSGRDPSTSTEDPLH